MLKFNWCRGGVGLVGQCCEPSKIHVLHSQFDYYYVGYMLHLYMFSSKYVIQAFVGCLARDAG